MFVERARMPTILTRHPEMTRVDDGSAVKRPSEVDADGGVEGAGPPPASGG